MGGLLPESTQYNKGLISPNKSKILDAQLGFSNGISVTNKIKITFPTNSPALITYRTNDSGNALLFISVNNGTITGKILDTNYDKIKDMIKSKANSILFSFEKPYGGVRIIGSENSYTNEIVSDDTGYNSINWR